MSERSNMPMNRPVLVAPDKFKGTLTAAAVASALAAGLGDAGIEAEICPLADGGEGTIDAILAAVPGETQLIACEDALGQDIDARVGLVDNGRSWIIESAQAIGPAKLKTRRDPIAASSRGVGLLIAKALDAGASRIVVGIGGTSSTDGGRGAVEVLIEAGVKVRPRGVSIDLLCDVRTPWELCAQTYGPQKGVTTAQLPELQARLAKFALELPTDPTGVAMTGAGGGLAGGLWAHLGAHLTGGAAYVLNENLFGPRLLAARAVLTGEGKLDHQTLHGKAVGEVATRCRQAGVQCHAVVGVNALTAFEQRLLDIESVHEATTLAAIKRSLRQIVPQLPRS